jgi:predicted phage terminase large subunit-like protein
MKNRQRSSKPSRRPPASAQEGKQEARQATPVQLEAKRLENDLAAFVQAAWPTLEPVTDLQWNWHLDLICEYLTLIKEGRLKHAFGQECEGIIFNVPPRTMKSLLITVLFPAWVWTADPARRWMFVSYAETLSTQHSVYRRNVLESEWYQQRWGQVFSFAKDQNLKTHYENSSRGQMFSTAMHATATGLGGDILIFDDPLNPDQALSELERRAVNCRFDQTFRSRLNDPVTGVKIIVMQRLHELDLTGHVLAKNAAGWLQLRLPAIAACDEAWRFPATGRTRNRSEGELLWPGRLPGSYLGAQKAGLGSWAFAGQYQQEPAPLEGGLFKRNWIRYYRSLPERFDFMVQSWDCTFKASEDTDFVAGQVWGKAQGKYYMLPYRVHDRMDFGPTKRAIKSCHAAYPKAHAILIEDKANGPAIISELRQEIAGIVAVDPEGGKLARAQSIAPLWEAGSVELPDPQGFEVPWLDEYIHNICAFPKAAHDDDMDATSQALIYMRTRMGIGMLEYIRREAAAEPGRDAFGERAGKRAGERVGDQ